MKPSEGLIMSLPFQVSELSNRIQADLRAGLNYYGHTKDTWELVQELANQGREFTLKNLDTGSIVDAKQLAHLSAGYVTIYLAESVFQHFVALFEDFVFDLLRLWLTAYPAGIPNKDKKPVDLAMVIDAADKDAILGFIIDRELNALKYDRPMSWFRYLNDRVKLGCPTDEQIERFAEIKASRDLLSHNRGIVNETYVQKAGGRARYKLGQRLEIPEPYLRETWTLIGEMVHDMAAAARTKA
jgi:hypothetical protein